jgi:hypothetical protein
VVEDGLIVGIFTETNQFVQVSEPVENIIEDGIPEYQVRGYKNKEYYDADVAFATERSRDSTRTQTVRNISLESQFYTLFRSKLRNILSDYDYKEFRDELLSTVENKQYLYKMKMKKVELLIRHMLTPFIDFIDFDEDVLKQLNQLTAIVNTDEINKICLMKSKKQCIPSKHLVSGIDNDKLYYGRLADEIIRYTRIRTFLFDSAKYLNIGNVEYQLNDNEILYLHSLLLTDKLDKLIPMHTSKYIESVTREFANPRTSSITQESLDIGLAQQYSNTNVASLDILTSSCVTTTGPVLLDKKKWNTKLHDGAIEHVLQTSVQCSFYIIMHIMYEKFKINENIYQIKQRLIGYYTPLLKDNLLKICDMLDKQGKRQFSNLLKKRKIEISTMIMNDNYIITAIDMWVIAMNLQLPIIMFHSNTYLPFSPGLDWLRLGGDPETDAFYFVRMINNTQYNLITPPSALRDLNGFQQMIESPIYDKHIQTFQEYVQNYQIVAPILNVRKPRQKKVTTDPDL